MKKAILLLSLLALAVTGNAFAGSSVSCPTSVNVGSQLKITVVYEAYSNETIKGLVTELFTNKASYSRIALASEIKVGPYMILFSSPVYVPDNTTTSWSNISVLPSTVPSVLKGKTIELNIMVINNGGQAMSSESCWIKVN